MPKVDTILDDELLASVEADAKEQSISRAALLREIIQEHYNTPAPAAAPQATVTGSDDVKVLTAKVDALTRYMCLSRPLDERIMPEEEKSAKESWERVRKWESELLKKEENL